MMNTYHKNRLFLHQEDSISFHHLSKFRCRRLNGEGSIVDPGFPSILCAPRLSPQAHTPSLSYRPSRTSLYRKDPQHSRLLYQSGKKRGPYEVGLLLEVDKAPWIVFSQTSRSCDQLSFILSIFFKLSVMQKVTPIVFWRLKNDKEILYNRLPPTFFILSERATVVPSVPFLINIYKCTLHLKLHYSKVSYKKMVILRCQFFYS